MRVEHAQIGLRHYAQHALGAGGRGGEGE